MKTYNPTRYNELDQRAMKDFTVYNMLRCTGDLSPEEIAEYNELTTQNAIIGRLAKNIYEQAINLDLENVKKVLRKLRGSETMVVTKAIMAEVYELDDVEPFRVPTSCQQELAEKIAAWFAQGGHEL